MPNRIAPLLILLCGCSAVPARDPIAGYEFIGQFLGDGAVEQGPTVCGVARTRHALHWLPHDTNLTCRGTEWPGSPVVGVAPLDLPVSFSGDVQLVPIEGLATKVRAWNQQVVALVPDGGVVVIEVDEAGLARSTTPVWWELDARLADLEVDDGMAWLVGGTRLYGVDLRDLDGGVTVLDLGGPAVDLSVHDGIIAVLAEPTPQVVGNELLLVDITEPDSPRVRSSLALEDETFDGVGLRADEDGVYTAWLTQEELLFTADLDDLDAPEWKDDSGVEAARGGVTLVTDDHLLQAPGFDRVLGVTRLGNPRRPKPTQGFIGGNGVFDANFHGHTLLLAVGSGGIHAWGPPRDYDEELDR